MTVLLSIKPEYASRIFDGSKKFEFRRTIFKRPVTRVVVYASAPISKIIGEFTTDGVICDNIQPLWDMTKCSAGISEQGFFSYFVDKEWGYAIKIGKTRRYRQPRCLNETYGVKPPQSFLYL